MMEVGDENTWFTECLQINKVIILYIFLYIEITKKVKVIENEL